MLFTEANIPEEISTSSVIEVRSGIRQLFRHSGLIIFLGIRA